MLHRGVGIGSISVSRQESGPFSDYHIGLLETFADQAVIAIENVWLFRELQRRTEALAKCEARLAALSEVNSAMNSTLELETVLQTIVQHAIRLTGLDSGAIFEYDERAAEFRLQASDRLEPEMVAALRRTPIRKGDGTVGAMAVTLAPAQVADIVDDIYQGSHKKLMIKVGNRAVLTVPLLREDRVIGALSVGRNKPGPIAAEVVELLQIFAVQAAIAIQSARLRREIAENGRLSRATSRLEP
jgi:GAF domain-containing protein